MFENPTVNLNALCNSCAKISCCPSDLIFTFLCERAIHPVPNLRYYTSLFIQPHKQESNGVQSITETNQNHTSVHTNFFLQWPLLSPPKILTFHPKSPCIQPVIVESNISMEHWYNYVDRGNLRYSREHLSQEHFSTTHPTWTGVGLSPDLKRRAATNHLRSSRV
jgi:hypothetical protein